MVHMLRENKQYLEFSKEVLKISFLFHHLPVSAHKHCKFCHEGTWIYNIRISKFSLFVFTDKLIYTLHVPTPCLYLKCLSIKFYLFSKNMKIL